MKKVLVLNRGALGEQYGQAAPDGGPLRCSRLEQAGRLELVRILNNLTELSQLPIFVAERARVMETRAKARERTLAAKAAGKLTGFSSAPAS